jgi:hypothetical protein
MAYLSRSSVMKNGETCGKGGNICAIEASIIDKDDSGSTATQRIEEVYLFIFVFLIHLH